MSKMTETEKTINTQCRVQDGTVEREVIIFYPASTCTSSSHVTLNIHRFRSVRFASAHSAGTIFKLVRVANLALVSLKGPAPSFQIQVK